MADESKPNWMNWMSLATVILAVCATLSTFKGGGYSTQSVINQTLASDQWAFYQAKSTKQHLYELQVEQLRLQSLSLPANSAVAAEFNKVIEKYTAEIKRYSQEKKDIEAKAQEIEKLRDEAKLHGKPFGLAVMFLQVAILLNSIAGLMKVQKVWWASVPVGIAGLVFFADGFFAFF
jgi:cell division protein FtsB